MTPYLFITTWLSGAMMASAIWTFAIRPRKRRR